MSDEHKITLLSTPLGPAALIDGREIPHPDQILYEVPTNMTVLKYKGKPHFLDIGPGGGGRVEATVKDGYIKVTIEGGGGSGGGYPNGWGVITYNDDEEKKR
jgi:hypothetical protein